MGIPKQVCERKTSSSYGFKPSIAEVCPQQLEKERREMGKWITLKLNRKKWMMLKAKALAFDLYFSKQGSNEINDDSDYEDERQKQKQRFSAS